MRVLLKATRGLTAKARHPNGSMDMIRGLVPDFDRVCDGVRPKRSGGAASHQVGSRQFHDAADGSFRDAVQLMDVRRAGCGVHPAAGEQLRELLR
eukprot:6208160-Pleurochrysis_carterae.AAC.1